MNITAVESTTLAVLAYDDAQEILQLGVSQPRNL